MAFPLKLFTFLLFSSQVSLAYSSLSLQTDIKVTQHAVKGLFRNRRQVCSDGTYIHEGRMCCLCGAGLRLERHCSLKADDGQCEVCDPGTYSSDPNYQPRCEPCTSCDHPNTNLEVVEHCTTARNTKCGCKEGHFCVSGTETCRLCHPCQECGTKGVKVACTATNNTICNDTAQGGNGAIIGGVIATIVLLIVSGGLLYLYLRKKRRRFCPRQDPSAQPNGTATEMESLSVKDVDRHLHDIARILGWRDMKEVAMRTEIKKTDIENCQRNHPGEAEEQTLELLGKFVEKHGRSALSTLIDTLRKSGKNDKVEEVTEILRNDNAASSNI